MQHAYIAFWDKEEPKLRITLQEYQELKRLWNPPKGVEAPAQVWIHGGMIHKKDVKRIYPPEKPEQIALPTPVEKPISKEKLEELKKKFKKYPV